jgi:hypothetical protein
MREQNNRIKNWELFLNENATNIEYLFHGTTDSVIDDIMENGLNNPYLTDSFEKAEYYSVEASEDDELGGSPIILKVMIPDVSKLRVDFNELDEPVGVSSKIETIEKNIQLEYQRYMEKNPESYDEEYDIISIKPEDYYVSLNTVNTVRYDGIIHPKFIEIYE